MAPLAAIARRRGHGERYEAPVSVPASVEGLTPAFA